ncbi:MAG: hypothetical protein GY934_22895 [Gammaproteobacteria bacterium]|nr:hypothetical protein [Gammaproteobacteria bacterium]
MGILNFVVNTSYGRMANALILLLSITAAVEARSAPVDELRQLEITVDAENRMYEEYLTLNNRGQLSNQERGIFQSYLSNLVLRINEQCRSINERYPELDLSQYPCDTVLIQKGPSMEELEQSSLLSDELVAMDAELAKGLTEVDELLLQEQEKISARASALSSIQTTGGNEQQTAGDAAAGTTDSSREDSENGKTGEEESSESGEGDGGSLLGYPAGGKGSPYDIPDGSDDDIVARQLREAAEKESDPELKRKLWDEYRRYKQSYR